MVQAKTELFEPALTERANLFKSLSHPARIQILLLLAKTNSCITGDISDKLPLGRTTVNQHLKELKQAEFVTSHVDGSKTKYCLNPEKIKELQQSLLLFLKSINVENYKCK